MFKIVLFPVDNSRDSQDAAETVAELVKLCGSRLVILSVEPEASAEAASPTAEAIDQLLANAKAAFTGWGIQEIDTMHRKGMPAFCICDIADELNADLIIMGCRGVGLTEEGAADSVSNRVVNLAPCPVLIVP
jgi:nucleotide-binding universal stress UspA family protein